tara:strand:+ start:185 stop:388 length:204 start_codon:yes stop_codon:yes gene_type:complete
MSETQKRASFTRPVFFIFQIKDEDGEAMEFDRDRIEILAATRDTQTALDLLDKGDKTVTYKRIETIT